MIKFLKERIKRLNEIGLALSKEDDTNVIFESEDGEVQTFTYKELMEAVCVFSNGLINDILV